MSHKANPKLIGVFVVASGILLVAMILFFGSSSLFRQSTRFILFFDQSVNGLNLGSPVKFRGVPVGSVERILIRAEGQREESNAIPVIIRIDQARVERDLGLRAQSLDPESIQEWLNKGLLARLSLESIITGQLFVEFSVDPDKAAEYRTHLTGVKGLVEIPTQGSPLDEITADTGKLIANLGAIDIPRLNENVNTALEHLSSVLGAVDAPGISHSVTEAAQTVTEVIGSEQFRDSVAEMHQAFASINETAKSYNLDSGRFGQTIETWSAHLEQTLDGFDQLVAQTNGLLDPRSDILYEWQNTLRELSHTAQSIRALTEYLERNPNALITGRAENDN